MDHLEFELLIRHFEGALDAAQEQRVAEHLSTCGACAADARKLASFPGFVKPREEDQVPQAITAHLLNIYRRKERTGTTGDTLAQRIAAVLTFDDWKTALNERLLISENRHLLYRAASFDVDLRFDFAGDVCRITGQVFPAPSIGSARILSEAEKQEVAVNDLGEFVFPPVKIGNYNFELKVDELVIQIPDLPILN